LQCTRLRCILIGALNGRQKMISEFVAATRELCYDMVYLHLLTVIGNKSSCVSFPFQMRYSVGRSGKSQASASSFSSRDVRAPCRDGYCGLVSVISVVAFSTFKFGDVVVVGAGEVTGLLPTGFALLSVTPWVELPGVVEAVLDIGVTFGF
jgi:hypothetical protein